MTEAGTGTRLPRSGLFADLPPTPESHFKIHFFGAVLGVIERVSAEFGSIEAAVQRFPFLAGYANELASRVDGLSSAEAWESWQASRVAWERTVTDHLPLRTLEAALGLEPAAVACLITAGLGEEDARFGNVFDLVQGGSGGRRPTTDLLRQCWQTFAPVDVLSSAFARFREAGLIQVLNHEAPRPEWVLQVPPLLWDILRGSATPVANDFVSVRKIAELPTLAELVLPSELHRTIRELPALMAAGQVRTLVVRGPARNGRHTVLRAIARALDRCVIECRWRGPVEPDRWRQACSVALLQRGMLIVECEAGPGEIIVLPECPLSGVPVGVVMERHGGLSAGQAGAAFTLELPLPAPAQREQLWSRCLPEAPSLGEFAERFRLGSGAISGVARLARVQAAAEARPQVTPGDVQHAARSLRRGLLEPLAQLLPNVGDLGRLRAGDRTWRELEHLERRCRHRERLPDALGHSFGGARSCGVRALLHGPSGTGKTLAAQLLAATLCKDLYRVDLSAVVNKYIGETEKSLNRVFAVAEELDAILLLDEGDALLTRRTDVQTANDRYANLETNFLLQRLETFDGIVFVTTNARDRIDPAFERRMDVLVEFLAPDATERWQLWQDHLPPTREVDEGVLSSVASACELTGGQIRNAALHASLLALDNGGIVTTAYVAAAVRREYAKSGASCPLRM